MLSVQNNGIKFLAIISGMFIVDLILGFNGKLLLIGGIPIRKILSILITVTLTLLTIYSIKKEKLTLFRLKSEKSLWKLFNGFDYAILSFLGLNLIWIFIIPLISGYGVTMALKQTISLGLLAIYFPISILIKLKTIKWHSIHQLIEICVFLLAVIHIILYLGEIIFEDATFALSFFGLIKKITFGYSQRPVIMYPRDYFKIIYPTSIFLILVPYFALRQVLSLKSIVVYIIGLTALFTTLTKSLWFGIIGGVLFLVMYNFVLSRKHDIMMTYLKVLPLVLITIISSIFLNYFVFNDYVFIRLENSFAVQEVSQNRLGEKVSELNNSNAESTKAIQELAGTKRANFTRVIQTKMLLTKWLENPWFGFGYGSYVKNYLRSSEQYPYSYEMLLPSMLMQIGILGVMVWIMFFIFLIRYLGKNYSVQNKNTITIAYIVVALAISSQFNPFLICSSGMSVLLFCLIEAKYS